MGESGTGPRETGERVEELLARLRTKAGPAVAETAEELVTCLVRLYGDGLAAIMRTIRDDSRLQAMFVADPLVESLLLIHGLHPLDVNTRIRRALGRLGVGAELLSVSEDGAAVIGLAHGGSTVTDEIERAVMDAAPEITGVSLAPRDPPLLQIGRRPAETR
jgi:hypothetical protein